MLQLFQLQDHACCCAKARYRKGRALELCGDISSAGQAIPSAAAASPDDEAIRQALAKLKDERARQQQCMFEAFDALHLGFCSHTQHHTIFLQRYLATALRLR